MCWPPPGRWEEKGVFPQNFQAGSPDPSPKWRPTPVFLPRESHGQGSLAHYSSQGCKEPGVTEVTAWHRQRRPPASTHMLTTSLPNVCLNHLNF